MNFVNRRSLLRSIVKIMAGIPRKAFISSVETNSHSHCGKILRNVGQNLITGLCRSSMPFLFTPCETETVVETITVQSEIARES